MKAGKYPDGAKVLRAKIDLASPNMHMRDPLMYRIKHTHHHRTGNDWCIYPMYDFAHGGAGCDRAYHAFDLYAGVYPAQAARRAIGFIEQLELFPSKQYEFARLNMTYTVMSKRKLLQLVDEGHVEGWDDPRMPTISGLRPQGV